MPAMHVVRVTLLVAPPMSTTDEASSYSTLLLVDLEELAAGAPVVLARRRAEMLGYRVVGVEAAQVVSSSFGGPAASRRPRRTHR